MWSAMSARAWRVSSPCWVLPSAMRNLPSSVLDPVVRAPWNLQTRLPFSARPPHCSFVRFDVAWQRGQWILPPAVSRVGCQFGLFIIINNSIFLQRILLLWKVKISRSCTKKSLLIYYQNKTDIRSVTNWYLLIVENCWPKSRYLVICACDNRDLPRGVN